MERFLNAFVRTDKKQKPYQLKLNIMRKIKFILSAIIVLSFMACEGPQGPSGLDGLDAPKAEVYEQTLNFSYDAESNIWDSEVLSFDGALAGDIYLGYISLGDGLFTSLPASFFGEFGEFQYVFDHDFDTVQFQIIGDNDLSSLGLDFTNGVVTRIAIIPADLFASSNLTQQIDISSLMNNLNLNDDDIIIQ